MRFKTATGIVRLANAEMVRALRVVTVNRGIDPREFALLPFGGAGPMHAADLAAEMGMARMICPRAGGVLSALGLLASARTARHGAHGDDEAGRVDGRAVAAAVSELRDSLSGGMDADAETISYELRYEGQSFELPVEAGPEPSSEDLEEGSPRAHQQRYGFEVPDAPVELVAIRLALEGAAPNPSPRPRRERSPRAEAVRFGDDWHDALVARGEPSAGTSSKGRRCSRCPSRPWSCPRMDRGGRRARFGHREREER